MRRGGKFEAIADCLGLPSRNFESYVLLISSYGIFDSLRRNFSRREEVVGSGAGVKISFAK
ncbi:hypothetical protein D3C81_2038520 [compost metagenome]